MSKFTLQWKNGPLQVDLPDKNLETIVKRPELPSKNKPIELVKEALQNPIGCPTLKESLKPGDKVALLVTDTMDSIVGSEGNVGQFLLDMLNSYGIPDSNITLIHSAGMHGHYRARQRLGELLLWRVRYVEHHPFDEENLALVGITSRGTAVWVNRYIAEADYVIGIGGCGVSLYGFQGGGGIILPGSAGRDTIRHNHSYILNPRPLAGWGPGNPLREDVQEAADLAKFKLKIDFTANTVLAGYHRQEWPVAVDYVKKNLMTPMRPVDIYIFGFEGASDLLSFYIHLEMAHQAIHEHGIIIALISAADHKPLENRPVDEVLQELIDCTEAWMRESGEVQGDRAYFSCENRCRKQLLKLPYEELTRIVVRRLGEPRSTTMTWSHKRTLAQRRVFLVTEGISEEEGIEFGFAYTTGSFEAALRKAFSELGKEAKIAVNLPPSQGWPLVQES